MTDLSRPNRDLRKVHPLLRLRLVDFFQELGRGRVSVFITEAFRSPERQGWLYGQGRTADFLELVGIDPAYAREGPKLTNAKPGQSYHNLIIEGFELSAAVDVAVWDEDVPWSKSLEWTGTAKEWEIVHEAAHRVGLQTLTWERPHIQLPFPLDELREGRHWPDFWLTPRRPVA